MKNPDRRKFLIVAPAAAAAGLVLADSALFTPSTASAQAADGDPYTLIPGATVQDDFQQLVAGPGNKTLYHDKNLTFVLTTEKTAAAKEFEWHEHRDHIFHILDGSAIYELGGKPQGAHSSRPGEWNSPASDGAKAVTVVKGDILVIPRGTPHRRKTPESVTFALISPETPAA